MHPLPENVAWEDYLQSVKQITNEAYPAAYEVVIDGVIQYTVTQRYRKFILENADGSQVNLPFHYTPEGTPAMRNTSVNTFLCITKEIPCYL